jgi:hypothetical protein
MVPASPSSQGVPFGTKSFVQANPEHASAVQGLPSLHPLGSHGRAGIVIGSVKLHSVPIASYAVIST